MCDQDIKDDLSVYNPEGSNLRKTQLRIKEILDHTVKILDANNVRYWLQGGTLLGAIRHGGFIPWDDDIDIDVPCEQYKEMIKILKSSLPSDYYVNETTFMGKFGLGKNKKNWIQVKDKKSRIFVDGVDYGGLYIDIFPSKLAGEKEIKYLNYFRNKGISYTRKSFFTKAFYKLCYKLVPLIFKFEIKRYRYEEGWDYAYDEISNFEKLSYVYFENSEYSSPYNPDSFLKKSFGDYMSIPPKESRPRHFNKVEFF